MTKNIETVLSQIPDEIKKAGFPDEWKEWGAESISTERWIEIVHRSLSQK